MDITRRKLILSGSAAMAAMCASSDLSALFMHGKSKKKGLAGIAPVKSGLVTHWYYDWTLHPAKKGMPFLNPRIQFHPMCWGWKSARGEKHIQTEQTDIQNKSRKQDTSDNSSPEGLARLRTQAPKVLFGFNEPDKVKQANLTVEQAVSAWPLFQGVAHELVGPSCAQPGREWMEKFVSQVQKQKLQLDALGYHSYGSDSAESFIENLEAFHAKYQLPVWVTEFAVADWRARDGKTVNRYSVDQVAEFMKKACAYMEKTPWIHGYAWFPTGGQFAGPGRGPLVSSMLYHEDGSLNDLGKLYQSI